MFFPRCASLVFLLSVVQMSFAPSSAAATSDLGPGIVVEKIEKHSEAEKSGFREGDILLSWTRGDHNGNFESPFDLSSVLTEEVPRGIVAVQGLRANAQQSWLLKSECACTGYPAARPNFSRNALSIYHRAEQFLRAGKSRDAVRLWKEIAAQNVDREWLFTWLLWHSTKLLTDAKRWRETDWLLEEAARKARGISPAVAASLQQWWAYTYLLRGNPSEALKHYYQALESDFQVGGESLSVANDLLGLATANSEYADQAAQHLERALAIQQKLAPNSLELASSLVWAGDLENLRGDLEQAEDYFQKALTIQEKFASGKPDMVFSLISLGYVAWQRGDLPLAENYLRRGLSLEEGVHSRNFALALSGFANVALSRGELAKAEYYQQQALVVHQKLNPASLDVAHVLNDLAAIAVDSGQFVGGEGYGRNALAIEEKLEPDSYGLANTLSNLGEALQGRGELKAASAYYDRSLRIFSRLAPKALGTAITLQGLGTLYVKLGDLHGAEESYQKALAILEKLTPGTWYLADTLADLARIKRHKQQLDDAQKLYQQALDALESQAARLGGGSEVRSSFRARHQNPYREYVDLLVHQGKPDIAFQVTERSRARSLTEALAAGHLDIQKGVDTNLLEQERSLREKFTARSNYRIRLLGREHTEEQIKALDKEIAELLIQYEDVQEQIRSSSPAYAALTQPQALHTSEIQQQLLGEDQNTLLLEYSLGEERSFLFALTPTTLHSYQLPSRKQIDRSARRVYALLTARNRAVRGESNPQRQARLQNLETRYEQAVRQLSRMILAPGARELQNKRLLVVTDGALAYVPFALLPSPQTSQPLIAEHEIVNLPSASVLAVLRQQEQGRARAPKAVAVLADPVFSQDDPRVCGPDRSANAVYRRLAPCLQGAGLQADVSETSPSEVNKARVPPVMNIDVLDAALPAHLLLRSAGDVGLRGTGQLHLNRLPYTRREADAVAALTPADQRLEALDFRASRATAMSADLAQYRIVHFATHGLLDSRHPELSGLVLSLVDEQGRPQNGFLELQDIYNMNLSADLVVLSACETGLGKEVDGEGLVGLTRGFMYAGASRVLASLWRVDDEATAALMKRFYEGMLREGKTAAEALREAQLWMQSQRKWREPYYWAGFVLQGDWK